MPLLTALVVVATTHHSRTNDLTTSKAFQWGYQVTNRGITRELDKEPLLHCSSIYITYKWSVLQQYLTDPKVHAATSYPLLIHHASTLRLPCFLYVP